MNDNDKLLSSTMQDGAPELMAVILGNMLADIVDITDDGRVIYGRKRVDAIGSMNIQIRSDEHSPPHFHVIGPDIDASFTIDECTILNGTVNGREYKIIKKWHSLAKARLVNIWNETRPSDCPVGNFRGRTRQ